MKIAVPIWEDKVSPVLDTAAKLLIIETLNQNEIGRTEALLDELEISRRCFRIRKLNIDVLICGAVSRTLSDILAASGIHIIPGIAGPVEEILGAYFSGALNQSKFLMPGCKKTDGGKNILSDFNKS
jgi:predicted Fe-Mo cluster-binding NifX family protein